MIGLVRMTVIGVLALASAAWAWQQLKLLPEPEDDPEDAFTKPPYASLSTRSNAAAVVVASVTCAALCTRLAGWWTPLAWALLAGAGSVLAIVDLRTTYLPTRLLRPVGLAAGVLLGIGLLATLVHSPAGAVSMALRMAAVTSASRLLFWYMWRWRAGIGFGDVRLATLLGLVTGAVSASLWVTGLLLGTTVGAAWALAVLLHRRRHPSPLGSAFAYGPALILGCWAALALSVATPLGG